METNYRKTLKNKKRIVIKVGSSTITHAETGAANLGKIEKLARKIYDLRSEGKEVVLVSSGAIAAGTQVLAVRTKARSLAEKQAFAAVGQAQLMMIYKRIFGEYNLTAGQVLLTRFTMLDEEARHNAKNTFDELLKLGVVPVVNENDTVSTSEIRFGDNDRLSALVSSLIGADLLILLSDVDGLYSDDPNKNPDAKFISTVEAVTPNLMVMAKDSTGSEVGTGGMAAKLEAARIACSSGADMIIASGEDLSVLDRIFAGEEAGTLFEAGKISSFDFDSYMKQPHTQETL